MKKIRTVGPAAPRQIPPVGKVEANTQEWRDAVLRELAKRPRGEQARIVEYVQRWYPKFSTGTLSATLGPDEKPGQHRYSKYIPLINRYLWPEQHAEVNEQLSRVLRTMTDDEQVKLAEFIVATRKAK